MLTVTKCSGAQQQTRARKQDDGKREFRHHEHGARAASAGGAGCAAASGFQRLIRVVAGDIYCRRKSENQRGPERREKSECEHGRVDARLANPWDS